MFHCIALENEKLTFEGFFMESTTYLLNRTDAFLSGMLRKISNLRRWIEDMNSITINFPVPNESAFKDL